jgi:hypothetical protein
VNAKYTTVRRERSPILRVSAKDGLISSLFIYLSIRYQRTEIARKGIRKAICKMIVDRRTTGHFGLIHNV